MCSPSRATLLTGRYPGAARRDAHPDPGRPAARPAEHARRARRARRNAARAEAPRRRVAAQLRARRCSGSGRSRATSPSFARTRRASPLSCASAGYEVAYKGKWHLTHPSGGGAMLGGWAPRGRRAHRATTTASPTGSRPTPARTPRPSTSAAATRVPSGEGWDEVYTRQVEELARPAGPPRAVLPGRLAGQPARRARLSGPVRPGRVQRGRVPRTSGCRCRRRSTRTCATSPPSTS